METQLQHPDNMEAFFSYNPEQAKTGSIKVSERGSLLSKAQWDSSAGAMQFSSITLPRISPNAILTLLIVQITILKLTPQCSLLILTSKH